MHTWPGTPHAPFGNVGGQAEGAAEQTLAGMQYPVGLPAAYSAEAPGGQSGIGPGSQAGPQVPALTEWHSGTHGASSGHSKGCAETQPGTASHCDDAHDAVPPLHAQAGVCPQGPVIPGTQLDSSRSIQVKNFQLVQSAQGPGLHDEQQVSS